VLTVAALGITSVAGLSIGLLWLTSAMQAPGPLAEPRAVVVPHGATGKLANELAGDGLIRQPLMFRAAVWLTRAEGPLHAAEFAFPAHASIEQVLDILRSAKPVEHRITLAEGLTAHEIRGVLMHAEAMTGDVRPIEEGSLLPQTYAYEYGTDRDAVIIRAKAAMDKELTKVWADRTPDLPLAGPRDALILASIVERETAKPEERPHVAAVYLNRLRLGMKLQADPTVVYLASGGTGALDHPLTRAELERDDPFNTYRSPGLPPAPICSPGADSLYAVLHPASSSDLYFVADGTGGHIFSRSYAEHDSAVTRLRALPPPPRGRPE
jgi:UPF0755 protein